MAIQIAPSILSADFANLERDILEVSDADWLHVDVMDGHFVPNLTIGLPVVERIAQVSPLPLDVHLMIEDPDRWAPRYAEVGAASVTFHLEAAADPRAIIADLHGLGSRASCAIKPGTPVEEVLPFIEDLDMVLVMTVEPGFGGQKFQPEMMPKLHALRAAAADAGTDLRLQTDGGIARATIGTVVEAGCDVVVAGSAIYDTEDRAAEIAALRLLADGPSHSV